MLGILLVVLVSLKPSEEYIVLVDSYAEECFHDLVPAGAFLWMKYEVLEGGFHEVDARMTDPHGHIAYSEESKHGDHQIFKVHVPGVFKLCFHNAKSSRVPKLLMFDFYYYFQEEEDETTEGTVHVNITETLTRDLKRRLDQVKNEMNYLDARLQIHVRINERSNESVLRWALVEFFVVIALCGLQTYYLLRFFETKRIV